MEYNFREIEKKWQDWWQANEIYKVSNDSSKPKYYVLDMFPYPSGAGLHVGHPLGYIASDIYARYKRLKGFNVLHPMGYDAFGLPAEQYAIEHGIHPAVSTKQNIENFRKQLDKIGFCFDWSRQVNTSEPSYYKWTQWIFLQLFKSYYDRQTKKAESIESLVASFEKDGNKYQPFPDANYKLQGSKDKDQETRSKKQGTSNSFTADQWNNFDEATQQNILMQYRLAYCGYGEVNWCEALGTVLANDEVVNGVSERGGYPVIKKKLRQWYLRITEYADRLLEGLQTVDFSEAMKEMQTNWIGKSYGAEIDFKIDGSDEKLRVFTTRPDTIFGVDFMVIAPEHELVNTITTEKHKQEVEDYIAWVKSRSERERMAEKTISGANTGALAINPFDKRAVPIYISEYVLAGYGTGAIMAVPCGDERDFKFAKHFNIDITNIIGDKFNGEEANPTKEAELLNSNFLTGMLMKDAIKVVITDIEGLGYGKAKVNYKMRDAAFSRQRYWGEPFPIVWQDGIAYPLDENDLPLELPYMEDIKPGKDGEGPLSNNLNWIEVSEAANIDLTPNPSPKERGAKNAVPGYITNTPEQWKILSDYAKENRQHKTEAEDRLWQALRNRQVNNCKFRRQHPVAGYIPDFVCLEKKLIVEIDGEYHNEKDQKKFDDARTEWLAEYQYKFLRFSNDEVLNNMNDVIQKISTTLMLHEHNDTATAPSPLERAGGEVFLRESSTMPGYAGSSWYFLRYMDPNNNETFCNKKASDYWNQVDVYVGGTEHAVGHLLYSRMWTKFLFDLGLISFDEPYKKLLNQGMIQGSSRFVYRINGTNYFLSKSIVDKLSKYHEFNNKLIDEDLINDINKQIGAPFFNKDGYWEESKEMFFDNNEAVQFYNFHITDLASLRIDINFVNGVELNVEKVKQSTNKYKYAFFILEDGKYICGVETEKMSKSKFNTVDPSELVDKYGADTFRMYEMFLGPVEQSKPWDTKGIEGVHRFLRKFWRLFYDELKGKVWNEDKATDAELKILHKAIKKIEEDTERFSYNTAVSAFMVCTNELADMKCNKKEILEPLVIMLSSYAPHIAEELFQSLHRGTPLHSWRGDGGEGGSVLDATYPTFNPNYLVESSKQYPISINGKLRTTLDISLEASENEVKEMVLQNDVVQKWLEGAEPKKIIFIKNKMVNVVIDQK